MITQIMKLFHKSAGALFFAVGLFSSNGADLPQLTLGQAHETALRDHPLIHVGDLKALVMRQVSRQVQSGFYPNLSANVVAVGTLRDNTRLAAVGALNNPAIFDRNAEGLMLSQLITDFAEPRISPAAPNFKPKPPPTMLRPRASKFCWRSMEPSTRLCRPNPSHGWPNRRSQTANHSWTR